MPPSETSPQAAMARARLRLDHRKRSPPPIPPPEPDCAGGAGARDSTGASTAPSEPPPGIQCAGQAGARSGTLHSLGAGPRTWNDDALSASPSCLSEEEIEVRQAERFGTTGGARRRAGQLEERQQGAARARPRGAPEEGQAVARALGHVLEAGPARR